MFNHKMLCYQAKRFTYLMPRLAYLSDSTACTKPPLKTPLIDFHLSKNANMVNFSGYLLPQQYEDQTILESHCFVREKCGIFDVSHMLQTKCEGEHRYEFIESLTTANMSTSTPGCSVLALFLNENGGIMDDFIVCNCKENYLFIVSNAACSGKISEHLMSHANRFHQEGKDVNVSFLNRALIAVQGPKAFKILEGSISSSEKSMFNDLYFMESATFTSLCDINALDEGDAFRITRCGYTGEDGYEISLPSHLAKSVVDRMTQNQQLIQPIGLAARDTLRLEAGMCLYGNELSESTTPAEAGLGWLIDGAEIFTTSTQQQVGLVTSGCLSPSLGHNIAMAYVKPEFSKAGEQLMVKVRKKFYPFTVTSLPFVPSHYVRRPKAAAAVTKVSVPK